MFIRGATDAIDAAYAIAIDVTDATDAIDL